MRSDRHHPTILLGTGCRSINPPLGLPLVGYPNPGQRANRSVGTDLFARAAVFGSPQNGAPSAAIVVLDTLGVSPHLVQRIRHLAAMRIKGLPPEAILVGATHTHSAPSLHRMQFGERELAPSTDYVDQTIENAVVALDGAWQSRAPVCLRVGRTEVRLGHNRRVVDARGRATNEWLDVEGRHTGFFNPNVRILLFEEAVTLQPRAVFSLYGCHPVTLGPGNLQASADYPGYFVQAIEAKLPGCFAMHLTGGAGNINPREGLANDLQIAKQAGDTLARAVLDELPHARPINPAPIRAHAESLVLPLGPDAHQNYSCRARDSVDGKTITSEIQVLRLGYLAIVTAPGELFGELALAIENTSPFATTFVVGYANDNLGYLVTAAGLREGGYESQKLVSPNIEPILLDTARTALVSAAKIP